MKVEKIRAKYFERNNLEDLDVKKARTIEQDLRRGKRRISKLPSWEPMRSEALELFDITIKAMDALAKRKPETPLLLEASRECFEVYVARYRDVVLNGE
jgi:hypothetical protein